MLGSGNIRNSRNLWFIEVNRYIFKDHNNSEELKFGFSGMKIAEAMKADEPLPGTLTKCSHKRAQ